MTSTAGERARGEIGSARATGVCVFADGLAETGCFPPGSVEARRCARCGVRRFALGAALTGPEVAELEAVARRVRLPARTVIHQEGDAVTMLGTITAGMVRLSLSLPDGRRHITDFLSAGDVIGLDGTDVHLLDAETVTPVEACLFRGADLERLLERYPRLKDRMLSFLRLDLHKAHINQLALSRLSPPEKVAAFLMRMSDRAERSGNARNPVHLPMTRADIADHLGLTIETVSRTFTRLKKAGTIRLPAPGIVDVADWDGLGTLARARPA